MASYVIDSEADGLLDTVTRCWIISAYNLETKEQHSWLEGDLGWMDVFNKADSIICHGIKNYDEPLFKKIFNYRFPKKVKLVDTVIISKILNYRRFESGSHSMEAWGEYFNQPKVVHEDWSQYSEEMRIRCETDVRLNVRIYQQLLAEFKTVYAQNPHIKAYIEAEHYVAEWCVTAEETGWPFDIDLALKLEEEMRNEMDLAKDRLLPRLGTKTVAVDKKLGIVETKRPKWTKKGTYDQHTANWFGVDIYSGVEGEERPIAGEYCRVTFEKLSLDSVSDVKIFLYRNGWEPLEWNYKMDPETRKQEKASPKITDESLEFLKGDGVLYNAFRTTSSRYNILVKWIESIDSEGNLHGGVIPIGTPSMRATHSKIVNVPSSNSVWGPEMRRLFTTKPGWKVIGCDSAGNQARGLAHYLGNPDFIHTLLHGDIHQYNADKLTEVLKEMGIDHIVPRSAAKRILYAFLFGASGAKLWSYIFGKQDAKKGNKLKAGFTKAVPGFKDLIDRLENYYGSTKKRGDGFITSLAGNKIFVDSFHKLLVYLLQATEKITCSAAIMLTMQRLEASEIPYIPLIFMHDEEDFLVPEEYAEQAAAIGKQAFADGPKLFGIEIMDGDAKIGDNWYDVH
jgi:DNA polymerase I-like protein with 3'-5' exonuclease and polymerase domains